MTRRMYLKLDSQVLRNLGNSVSFGEITELEMHQHQRVHKDEWTSNGVPFYRIE